MPTIQFLIVISALACIGKCTEKCEIRMGLTCYWTVVRKIRFVDYDTAVSICNAGGGTLAKMPDEKLEGRIMNNLRSKIDTKRNLNWVHAWTGEEVTKAGKVNNKKWYPGKPAIPGKVKLIVYKQHEMILQGMASAPTTDKIDGAVCQRQEEEFTTLDNCQYFVTRSRSVTFDVAQTSCQTFGGSLAMIKTQEIQDAIEEHVVSKYQIPNFTPEMWIGGYREDGVWYWLDGTEIPISGQRWANSPPRDRDRVIMSSAGSTKDNMRWFTKLTWFSYPYVCEVPVADPCELKQCLHGKKCVAIGCQANCECPEGFTGPSCEIDLSATG